MIKSMDVLFQTLALSSLSMRSWVSYLSPGSIHCFYLQNGDLNSVYVEGQGGINEMVP